MIEAMFGAGAVLVSFASAAMAWSLYKKIRARKDMETAEARIETAFMWSYLGERKPEGTRRSKLEPHEAIGDIKGLPRGGFAWPAVVAAFSIRTILIMAAGGVTLGFSEFWLGVHVALNFVAIIPLVLWLSRWHDLMWVSYDKPIKAAAAGFFVFAVLGESVLSVLAWLAR